MKGHAMKNLVFHKIEKKVGVSYRARIKLLAH